MTRASNALELNGFVKGLITEAGPLTFPEGASIDEANFVLKRDGSRERRLGMQFEELHQTIPVGVLPNNNEDMAVTTFRWQDVSGYTNLQIVVVQVGNVLKFFDLDSAPLSGSPSFTHVIDGLDVGHQVSYANVGGLLAVATGKKGILIFEYKGGVEIVVRTENLKIRDLFGVEDVDNTGADLREGFNVSKRPPLELRPTHLYNLRNQTWAPPMRPTDKEWKDDMIFRFNIATGSKRFPSNADSALVSMAPIPDDTQDPIGDRFYADAAVAEEPGSGEAPRGYFIIDALDRGKSRLDAHAEYFSRYEGQGENGAHALRYNISTLPVDRTTGGAEAVESYSGRVWYGGFNGELIGGDRHSPNMGSYVLFSRLVREPSDATRCHQMGDPTSKKEPDLLDTDGGFIYLPGCKNIRRMQTLGQSLLVFSESGVWSIMGADNSGFKSTDYLVTKVTSVGCEGPYGVVGMDTSVMYWGKDGIYSISPDERGSVRAENITQNTIQTLYNEIPFKERSYVQGLYQGSNNRVRWIYNTRPGSQGNVNELVLDLNLGAFSKNDINTPDGGFPRLSAIVETPDFKTTPLDEQVVVNAEDVVVGAEQVVLGDTIVSSEPRRLLYVAIMSQDVDTKFTFSSYRDPTFYDWRTTSTPGVDSPAHFITGYLPGEDFQRNKQIPYLFFHFLRTEDGFDSEFNPTNQSSLIAQVAWDWTNSPNSLRWSREFQAYRYKRHYIPADINDSYDTGDRTIVTKNKVRGRGRVFSIHGRTEPGKDAKLQGWSMVISGAGNV